MLFRVSGWLSRLSVKLGISTQVMISSPPVWAWSLLKKKKKERKKRKKENTFQVNVSSTPAAFINACDVPCHAFSSALEATFFPVTYWV